MCALCLHIVCIFPECLEPYVTLSLIFKVPPITHGHSKNCCALCQDQNQFSCYPKARLPWALISVSRSFSKLAEMMPRQIKITALNTTSLSLTFKVDLAYSVMSRCIAYLFTFAKCSKFKSGKLLATIDGLSTGACEWDQLHTTPQSP